MVRAIEPYTDLVQLDIADGKFVPNTTISGYQELKEIETNLNFEIHLMVENPGIYFEPWSKIKKAIRFLIHWESTDDFSALINQFKINGQELGCVFNPETDYNVIEPYIDKIKLVQFMTVNPGFQGASFLPEVLEKIRDFHLKFPQKIIQVDGGVKPEIIKSLELVGVSQAAVGSYIFKSNDIKKAMKKLLNS